MTIPRFRRDISSTYNKILNTVASNYTVDNSLQNTITYLPLIDTVPSGSTNASVDSTVYIISSSSIKFSSGYVATSNISDINYYFTFQSYVYLNSFYSPLISIQDISNNNLFSISYNYSLSSLVISRYISTNTYQVTNISNVVLSLNTWYHLAVTRNYEVITVYVNASQVAQISNYWYSILPGTVYIGKDNISTLQGNLTNIQLIDKCIYPDNYFNSNNLDVLKLIRASKTYDTELSHFKLINFITTDNCNNVLTVPNAYVQSTVNTSYDPVNQQWSILPSSTNTDIRNNTQGLALISDTYIKHPYTFTIDLAFIIPTTVINDVVIVSNWKSNSTNSFYFVYKQSLAYIQFVYVKQNSSTIYTQNIFYTVPLGIINYLALQVDTLNNSIKVFSNGKLVLNITSTLNYPSNLDYCFNYNVNNNINNGSILYLKYFTLTKTIKYLGNNYIPYIPSTNVFKPPYTNNLVKYHSLENSYSNRLLDIVPFTIGSDFTITAGTPKTITITQSGTRNYPITYNLNIQQPIGKTELVSANYTLSVSTITINAGSTTATFTLSITNPGNVYKGKFNLLISNSYTTNTYTYTITNDYAPVLSSITSISNYLDAFIADSTGTLKNITGTITASTSATFINSSTFGYGYEITSSSQSINLPSAYTNVLTVFVVYKELTLTPYRTYVGSSSDYTFNGGVNGELVGARLLNPNDYVKVQTVSTKSSTVKIAENDSVYFLTNELANKVLVYSKNTAGIWQSSSTEIVTSLSGSSVLQNAALDINTTGNIIALGVKNANNGQGVIQIWINLESGWSMDLQLSSAIPSPYYGGFGSSVCIADNGLKVYVSELGASGGTTNTVYEFTKTSGIWSATPTYTFTGTGGFGYQIELSSDGTWLGILESDTNNLRIYKFSTSWSLSQTITGVQTFAISKDGNCLVTSTYSISTVNIYSLISGTWNLSKTITNSASTFGYSLDVDNTHNVLIGSPSENKVYLYFNSDTWTTPLVTSSSVTDYGYAVSRSNSSNVISDYATLADLYTNNGAAIPQNIISVTQNGTNKQLANYLGLDYSILSFQSSSGLSIQNIGSGKSGTSLNGIFVGLVMFSRLLTSTEITTVTTALARYLKMLQYSFYI